MKWLSKTVKYSGPGDQKLGLLLDFDALKFANFVVKAWKRKWDVVLN